MPHVAGTDAAPPRAHTLLVADTDLQRRRAVSRWVGGELSLGAKVLFKGWLPTAASSPEAHWIVGPDGPRGAREALGSGQLAFVALPTVYELTGGRAADLLALHREETRTALDDGWSRVAMTAESPHRPMGPGESAELLAHERGITALTGELPLTSLCQLTVPEEKDAAVWETVAVHHGDLVDGDWAVTGSAGLWEPRGELDAHVARRFAAALHAALAGAPADLDVDLAGVTFMDVACARLLAVAARAADDDRRLVLHHPTRTVRRLVDAVVEHRPPRGLVWADGGAVGRGAGS